MPRPRGSRNKPKQPARKRMPRRKFNKYGGFSISRLYDSIGIKKGLVAGAITSSNSTVLQLGTPVAASNGITNFYDVPFVLTFQLDQLTNYSDITNIADKYKLSSAICTFHAGNNAAVVGSSMPWIEYVQDTDDAAMPSIANIREKMGVRNKGFNQQGILRLTQKRLRVAASVYSGGVTSAYIQPAKSVWVDMAYPSVPHYGIKGVIRSLYLDGSNNSNQMSLDVKLSLLCADLQ